MGWREGQGTPAFSRQLGPVSDPFPDEVYSLTHSRWRGIHPQPWHTTGGHQRWTHLAKYYLYLLSFPSSGFPRGLSLVIFKETALSFAHHPYNFFFLRRWEDAGRGLVWCCGCLVCWLVGFQSPSHSIPPASQFPSPVATNVLIWGTTFINHTYIVLTPFHKRATYCAHCPTHYIFH